MSDGRTLDPAEARARIAQLEAENERLRRMAEDDRHAEELREALILAATTGTIGAPTHSRLLELVVQTAAEVIDAHAGHLFTLNEEQDELVFEVAVGPHAAGAERQHIPIGNGLVGLVALGGQPMLVEAVEENGDLISDVARQLGYVPESVLCVPLFDQYRVVGVLELLDKIGPGAFSSDDLTRLSRFGNLAAAAITQSRTHDNLASLIGAVLRALDETQVRQDDAFRSRVRAFAVNTEETDDGHLRESLQLARLVHEVAWQGEREYQLCVSVLSAVADYVRQQHTPTE